MRENFPIEEEKSGASESHANSATPTNRLAHGRIPPRILLQIADLVVRGRPVPEVLAELAPLVQQVTDCDFVSFSLHDAQQHCMLTHYWKRNQERGELDAFPVDECVAGWVWTNQQPILIPNLELEQRFPACEAMLRKHNVRSYFTLPMSTARRHYGALGLGKCIPDVLDAAEMESLARVAQLAAMALENHDTHRAWEEQQDRLRGLIAIGRGLSSSLEMEKLVPAVLSNLRQIMHCDHAVVMLLEEDGKSFRKWAKDSSCFEGPEHEELMSVPLHISSSTHAIETRQVTFWSKQDLARQQTPVADALLAAGIQSLCNVPLFSGSRTWGTLNLGSRQPDAFSQRDVEYLEQIASQIAAAFENARAYSDIVDFRDRQQSLVTISRELISSREVEKLVPKILGSLRQIVSHDLAVLGLLEEKNKFLRLHAVDAPGFEFLKEGKRYPVAETISARAIETQSITYLSDQDLATMTAALAAPLRQSGIRSVCIMPLLSARGVLGTLALGRKSEKAFREQDTDYLQQAANQIAAALENAQAYQEIAQLKDRLTSEKRYLESEINCHIQPGEIVGQSPALQRMLDYAAIVASTDSTVLITGETGTGKEVVARSIHAMSRRKDRSFIKLNCAAIPTGLLESELFGHEKGAFTGAITQKAGRLELADQGTLFLDEIGEISLELQPKLLRVLQDQEFERLGGTRTIHVDVRLIAATNRDLLRAVEEKQFRSDLFYRLHVFPLHMPPLRERREDIPALVRHFVAKCAPRLNKHIDFIPDEAIEAMLRWHWPGNIRELENFVERSVILSVGNRLQAPLAELRPEMMPQFSNGDGTLRGRERDHIVEILRKTQGVLSGPSGAAALLGLKRTTLQSKIQKLGISRLDYLN